MIVFEKYNVINDFQFQSFRIIFYGFREGYSTTLALPEICDHFRNNLDNREITCEAFVDLAKAFDTVNRSILLTKLEHYGVRGNALSLLPSYPKNKTKFTQTYHLQANKLSINVSQTKYMILSPKFKSSNKFNIELIGDLLKQVDSH